MQNRDVPTLCRKAGTRTVLILHDGYIPTLCDKPVTPTMHAAMQDCDIPTLSQEAGT